ncbi:MAG: DUF2442 domain-containing protein [Planctomycetota bacterium]
MSPLEITNISRHGIWLILHDKEFYLPYEKYPWFRNARISEIIDVELLHGFHLYWPELDVDLEIASLEDPSQFPLIDTQTRNN